MTTSVTNIVSVNNRNSTIDEGIRLLDIPGDLSVTIRAKAAGLQLTLLGLAEIQALRIQNLAIAAYRLEQKLYSMETIDALDPRKLMNTYEALNTALSSAISYVSKMGGMDFKGLEETLFKLAQEDPARMSADESANETRREVASVARDLLAELTDPSNDSRNVPQ